MSEPFPISTNEISPQSKEIVLHGEYMQLPAGHVLRDLEATRAQAFNGVTITELVLPSPVAPGSDIDKRVALIDFGEDAPISGKAILFNPTSQKELTNIAKTHSRYALVTMNYHPDDRLAGFVPLVPGQSETLGREDSRTNVLLGLCEADGRNELSRSHVTVGVDKDGLVTIEDHSKNGTAVEVTIN